MVRGMRGTGINQQRGGLGSTAFKAATRLAAILALIAATISVVQAAPTTFERAKVELRQRVYHDQNIDGELGSLYCGCDWQWVGRSGGRVDADSCGYRIRAQAHRGARTEWEHIVPMSNVGRARQCWQEGGRANCQRTDPLFNAMEADMHNLTIAVGELNADRSNFRFGVLPGAPRQHGACPFKVDFAERVVEPRGEVKGLVARVTFYMADRYDIRLSDAQQRLLMSWHQQFPPSLWELERDRRIAAIMGHHNPFVTGERHWTLGHRNTREGLFSSLADQPVTARQPSATGPVRGNRSSRIYHLSQGCPGYHRMAPQNIVEFSSEAAAVSAGYRKAGNCR